MYSVVHKGKVLDFRYTQNEKMPFMYNFYIGDIFIGQIFHVRKTWSAVSFHTVDIQCGSVDGFKTRHHAAEYLLKVCGFRER